MLQLVAKNNPRLDTVSSENLSSWPQTWHWSSQTGSATTQIKPPYEGKQQLYQNSWSVYAYNNVKTQLYLQMYVHLRLGIYWKEGGQKLPLQFQIRDSVLSVVIVHVDM